MNAHTPARRSSHLRAVDMSNAPLAAFVADEETRAMLATALGLEWPNASIMIGGAEEAIEQLREDPSARYLVVDLSHEASPLHTLDRLAEVCAPGTQLIALGDLNDVALYRSMRSAGVADYLVKPVTAEALSSALASLRRRSAPPEAEKVAPQNCRIVAVVGARGGVGATTISTTLAWFFAHEARERCMLVDLDLYCGAAALALDVEPSRGLCEVLENPSRIDSLFVSSAATRLDDNFYLLCSEESFDAPTSARPGAIELLAKELRGDFAKVVIDLPRANPELMRQGMTEANLIVVVTDLSLIGLRDANRLYALAKRTAPPAEVIVVANRVGNSKKAEIPQSDVEKAIGTTLSAKIPEDSNGVARALNTGKALPVAAPTSKATVAIKALARSLAAAKADKAPSFFAKLFSGSKANAG